MLKLLSLFGYKDYSVKITWDKNGEKEIMCVRAWGKINAITKVAKMRDVVNKAELTILEQSKIDKVRFYKAEPLGIAVKKEPN